MKIVVPSGALGTGTPYGFHYWKRYDECAKRSWFDDQKNSKPGEEWFPGEYVQPTRCGSMMHAIARVYHGPKWKDGCALVWDSYKNDPDWIRAMHMFGAYSAKYPHDEFGTDVEFEGNFAFGAHTVQDAQSAHDELRLKQQKFCVENFGVPDYTGAWDSLAKLDAKQVSRLEKIRDISLLGEGKYMHDLKTTRYQSSYKEEFAQYSEQFVGYCAAHDILYPDDPVRGVIVDVVPRDHAKNGKPNVQVDHLFSIFVKAPNEKQKAQFRNAMARRYKKFLTFGPECVNTALCFAWNRVCPHIAKCPRMSEQGV